MSRLDEIYFFSSRIRVTSSYFQGTGPAFRPESPSVNSHFPSSHFSICPPELEVDLLELFADPQDKTSHVILLHFLYQFEFPLSMAVSFCSPLLPITHLRHSSIRLCDIQTNSIPSAKVDPINVCKGWLINDAIHIFQGSLSIYHQKSSERKGFDLYREYTITNHQK